MNADGVPEEGDRITIKWPGGHDWHMEFLGLDAVMPAPTGDYLWLYGIVGYDEYRWNGEVVQSPRYRTLYARPIEPGVYEMKPKLL